MAKILKYQEFYATVLCEADIVRLNDELHAIWFFQQFEIWNYLY